jgi:hypothetical protein
MPKIWRCKSCKRRILEPRFLESGDGPYGPTCFEKVKINQQSLLEGTLEDEFIDAIEKAAE